MRLHFLLFVCILVICIPTNARAQEHPGPEGMLWLTGWPERSMAQYGASEKRAERELARHDLLPSIDTLQVGYRYERCGDAPCLSLALQWKPGSWGILDGRRVPFAEMPDSLLITSLTLHADVYAHGEKVTEAVIRLDGFNLAAFPGVWSGEVPHLEWQDLFVQTPPRAAQHIFTDGFELRNLDILSATFESNGIGSDVVAERSEAGQPRSTRRAVYDVDAITDVFIDLSWLLRPAPVFVDAHPNDGEHHEPRGNDMGRGAPENEPRGSEQGDVRGSRDAGIDDGNTETSGLVDDTEARRHGRKANATAAKNSGDDTDDDDDQDLLPAALTAVAAVGFVAYAGGTLGYFGNTKLAPIGLTAGFVRPRGGFLLQAGVNEAVLSGQGEEHLLGKALLFSQLFPGPIQPAIGAGLLVTAVDEKYTYQPSLSLGAAGNFGPVVLLGAYDLALGGMELSVSFNFKSQHTGITADEPR